jgi:flagellar hook-associated protein 2
MSMMGSRSTFSTYQNTKASIGNADIATVSATTKAANGTYALEVTQLAQAQKLATVAVSDKTAALGSAKLTFTFGTGSSAKTEVVEIKAGSSLEDIRDVINKADIGVSAAIVNDGTGYRLTLSSSETGTDQSMTVAVSDVDNANATTYAGDDSGDNKVDLAKLLTYGAASPDAKNMEQTREARNAVFTLDGLTITKSRNTVTDALDGVTLNLLAITDKPTTLSISQDTSTAQTAVNNFVSAYNTLNSTLKSMTAYDSETKTASVLTGDSAVRSIQSALKSVFSQTLSGPTGYQMLSDVGVSVNKDGTLEVDSTKMSDAIAKNFEAFVNMFAEGGMSGSEDIVFKKAGANTQPGNYDVNITKAATKGTISLTGGTSSAGGVDLSSAGLDLSSASEPDRTLTVTLHGVVKSIVLDQVNYNQKELAAAIQSKINSEFSSSGVSVSAEVDGGGIKVSSNTYGSVSTINIAASSFFAVGAPDDGTDVEGTINDIAGTGNGQTLKGAQGSDADGLELTITGENDGIFGTVTFTQGFAYQFSQIAENLLADDGVIDSRIDGMSETLDALQTRYDNMSARFDKVEEMYRTKFTALDTLLAKLNSTSDYLTQQLESLSGLWQSSKK